MARHSVDVMAKLTARVPRGHEGFWEIIRKVGRDGRSFTLAEIDLHSNVERNTVRDFLLRLVKAGYVEVTHITVGAYKRRTKHYHLVRMPSVAPRLRRNGGQVTQGTAQDRMWRSMKMLKRFTPRELAHAASLDKAIVSANFASDYIKNLHRAGYLKLVEPANSRLRQASYRLVLKTGPRAPMVQRTDWVWDPNLKKVMGPEGGAP